MSTDLVEASGLDTTVPWTASFASDIALGKPFAEAIKAHGITPEEWRIIKRDPEFEGAVEAVRLALRRPGGGFKTKISSLAEEMIPLMRKLAWSEETTASARVEMVRSVVKMAGLDASAEQGKVASGTPLQININLR